LFAFTSICGIASLLQFAKERGSKVEATQKPSKGTFGFETGCTNRKHHQHPHPPINEHFTQTGSEMHFSINIEHSASFGVRCNVNIRAGRKTKYQRRTMLELSVGLDLSRCDWSTATGSDALSVVGFAAFFCLLFVCLYSGRRHTNYTIRTSANRKWAVFLATLSLQFGLQLTRYEADNPCSCLVVVKLRLLVIPLVLCAASHFVDFDMSNQEEIQHFTILKGRL
jgi:hypothetical protein